MQTSAPALEPLGRPHEGLEVAVGQHTQATAEARKAADQRLRVSTGRWGHPITRVAALETRTHARWIPWCCSGRTRTSSTKTSHLNVGHDVLVLKALRDALAFVTPMARRYSVSMQVAIELAPVQAAQLQSEANFIAAWRDALSHAG
jgi:hypothetical protein